MNLFTKRSALLRLLAVVAVGALLAAGCGDDDEEAAPEAPAPAEPEVTAAPAEPEAPEPADEPDETPEPEEPEPADEPAAEAPVTGRCGDPARLGDSINFLNWADYIDEAILEMFEAECGVTVTLDTHVANEEAIAKVDAGNSGYSLVIVTDYAIGIMADQGLLAELDLSLVPNAANLDPNQMDAYYDPGNVYSLPYQYSTTGFAYDATAFDTPPTSWSVIYDQNPLCGQSSLLEDQREVIGSALVYLGYDWNETDPAAHEQALDLILAARDCVSGFDSANYIGNLASGEVLAAMSWGFAAGIAYLDNPNIRYIIPDEGGIIWQDGMVFDSESTEIYTAHVLINYMLEPDIGALITEFTIGYTPNLTVPPLLSDGYYEVVEGSGLTLTDEIRERLTWQVRDESHAIFAETWSEVLSAG
ncbi:MAG: spermidine/putrescine ABC transporter substrate-binding protein [Acidimicrobiaceae bacterium]|nr:spermidine/putrescine ABC transporter substrate-binding protein [Acidimicrobiaceae bacterium]